MALWQEAPPRAGVAVRQRVESEGGQYPVCGSARERTPTCRKLAPVDETLLSAYRRTAFIADTPVGRLVLRVGERCSELDALLAASGVRTWTYVTAFNPGSVQLTPEENAARQRQLECSMADLGLVSYLGEGVGSDGRWPAEPSVLVLGIGRNDARRLGREYGQLAVVFGEIQREAELLLCDPDASR